MSNEIAFLLEQQYISAGGVSASSATYATEAEMIMQLTCIGQERCFPSFFFFGSLSLGVAAGDSIIVAATWPNCLCHFMGANKFHLAKWPHIYGNLEIDGLLFGIADSAMIAEWQSLALARASQPVWRLKSFAHEVSGAIAARTAHRIEREDLANGRRADRERYIYIHKIETESDRERATSLPVEILVTKCSEYPSSECNKLARKTKINK